jgi:hypothetical protein
MFIIFLVWPLQSQLSGSTTATELEIAIYVQHISFQVYNIHNHQCTLHTQASVELSNIHFMINVINSMIMTSK